MSSSSSCAGRVVSRGKFTRLEKIYLWGVQVFRDHPADFKAATTDFGPDGDRHAYETFLGVSRELFSQYGDIPFVHWHHYEKGRLDMYIKRFGDPDGTAARVSKNLLDLLPITEESVALPLPSYSLKVIEKYIGFKRTQEEYGGDWAMAKYIEAVETNNQSQRSEFMNQILKYNEEDLQATWAVLKWLQELQP